MSDAITTTVGSFSQTRATISAYIELTKLRIAALVMVATALGFCLALPAGFHVGMLSKLVMTLLGTLLVAGGANAVNQFIESKHDAKMSRTAGRPIPTGRLTRSEVLIFGLTIAVAGVTLLALTINLLASSIAGLTFLSYVLIYTPLKRVTSLSVFFGAVPGALPPVIGWASAAGELSSQAWLLFTIIFVWQIPHVAAISWLYREDYARAGFPVLPVVDQLGVRTDLHMITHTVGLLTASFLPIIFGMAGAFYAFCAMGLGSVFLAFGIAFVIKRSDVIARWHLMASITYLPLLLACMMLDKLIKT